VAEELKQMLGDLSSLKEDRGVPDKTLEGKNIVKDSKEKADSATLTSNETIRVKRIATLIGEVLKIGAFAPGPEADRLDSLKTKKDKLPPAITTVTNNVAKEPDSGFSPLKLLIAGAIAAFGAWLFDTFGSIQASIGKILPKLVPMLLKFGGSIFGKITGRIGRFGTKIVKFISDLIPGGAAAAKFLVGEGGVLTKILSGVGAKILKAIKFIPMIGGIVGLGFAYMRFKNGDTAGAIAELVSSILSFIPGAGWVASALIDGAMILYDMERSKQKEEGVDPKNQPGFFKTLSNSFKRFLLPKLRYLPIIGGLTYFGDAFNSFKDGNWSEGFKNIGLGLIGFIGGEGAVKGVIAGIDFVSSLLEPNTTEATEVKSEGNSFWDFVSQIWTSVKERLGEVFTNVKNKAKEWLANAVSWIPGLGEEKELKTPSKPKELSAQQKINLKDSGWSTWEEYEANKWNQKTTNIKTDQITTQAQVNTSQILDVSDKQLFKQITNYHKDFISSSNMELNLLKDIHEALVNLKLINNTSSDPATRNGGMSSNTQNNVFKLRDSMNYLTSPSYT
jgi:hypothetical protein